MARKLAKALYWLAVVAVSLVLVVVLILFFEARDGSSLDGAFTPAPPGLSRA
jgi:hypothetical protein